MKRKTIVLPLLVAVVVVTVSAAASVAGRFISADSGTPVTARSAQAARAASAAGDHRDRVETELITLTQTGFDPAEITRPAGPFILEVDNRGGLEEVVLQLDALRGGREREARVRRSAPEWSDRLDLRPGTYVLREAAHPGWECRITVTPR